MENNGQTNPSNRLLYARTEGFREDAFVLDKPYTAVFRANHMGKTCWFKQIDKPTVSLGQVWIMIDPHRSDPEADWLTKAVKGPLARMRTALFDWLRQLTSSST